MKLFYRFPGFSESDIMSEIGLVYHPFFWKVFDGTIEALEVPFFCEGRGRHIPTFTVLRSEQKRATPQVTSNRTMEVIGL